MAKLFLTGLTMLLQLGLSISDGGGPPPPPTHGHSHETQPLNIDPRLVELPFITDASGQPLFTGLYSGPYFDRTHTPKNATAQLGGSALLPCRVKQAGDRSVSWIRNRDSYILSVDQTTFISNDRFRILRPEEEDEWNLHIKPVQLSDAGLYECQISTNSKMSHYIRLDVVVPKVAIEGNAEDIHAQAGSRVTLKCTISNTLRKPRYVNWFRDGQRLAQNANTIIRETTTVAKDGGSDSSATSSAGSSSSSSDSRRPGGGGGGSGGVGGKYESVISLETVRPEQSGRYSCHPSSSELQLPSASVSLHVVNGETLAAMSDDHHSRNGDMEFVGDVVIDGGVGVGGEGGSGGGASSASSARSSGLAVAAVLIVLMLDRRFCFGLIVSSASSASSAV